MPASYFGLLWVTLVGGGGAGADDIGSYGGGGGGGGMVIYRCPVWVDQSVTTSVAVTIGRAARTAAATVVTAVTQHSART